MKRILSIILILALALSLCLSTAAFAEDDYLAERIKLRFPELYNKEVATIAYVASNGEGGSIYRVTATDGSEGYYCIYCDAVDAAVHYLPNYVETPKQSGPTTYTNPNDTEDIAALRSLFDAQMASRLTITKVDDTYYSVTDGTMTMYFYWDDTTRHYQQYGYLENLAIFENAGISINEQNGMPYEGDHLIDPYSGLYTDNLEPCSVYDDVVGSLYPYSPYESGSTPGGSKQTSNGDMTKNPKQLINFYATGANSYTVTLPTQYSTSVTEDGTSLSGVFSFNLYDVVGDGTYFARLRVIDAENTERYWEDTSTGSTDHTHYAQQNAAKTLTYYEDQYMVNSEAGAKILYNLYTDEISWRNQVVPTNEPLGLENVVISKEFTTTAADFGPFTESTTLYILLDMEGRENLPHGTYKDILTFQSSIEKG